MTKIYPQKDPQRLIERFGKEYLYKVWAELGSTKVRKEYQKSLVNTSRIQQ